MLTLACGAWPPMETNPFTGAEAWKTPRAAARTHDVSLRAPVTSIAPVGIAADGLPTGTAFLALPAGRSTTARRCAVLGLLIERAAAKARNGEPMAEAVVVPGGVDQLQHDLNRRGDRLGRTTIRDALAWAEDAGLIQHVGNLGDHFGKGHTPEDRTVRTLEGAKEYALMLSVVMPDGSVVPAVECSPKPSPTHVRDRAENAPGRAWAQKHRRVEGALAWALDTAAAGTRNHTGFRLAWTLRKIGLSHSEALPRMRRYVSGVSQRGHAYTWREAEASLRSAYRSARREPGESNRLARMLAEEGLTPIDDQEPLEVFGERSLAQVVSKSLAEVNVEKWNALDDLDRRVLSHLRRWRIVGEPASPDTHRNVADAIDAPMAATVRSLHGLEARGYVERRQGAFGLTDIAPTQPEPHRAHDWRPEAPF